MKKRKRILPSVDWGGKTWRTLMLALTLLLAVPAVTLAAGKEAYASYNSKTKTLTFKCDDDRSKNDMDVVRTTEADGTVTYPWHQYRDVVEKVVYDASFCYAPSPGLMWNCDYMFAGFTKLKSVENFDNSHIRGAVSNLAHMFEGCTSLESFSMEYNLQATQTRDYSYMFAGCTSLASVELYFSDTWTTQDDIDGWKTVEGMFKGCTSLTSLTMKEDGFTNFWWHVTNMKYFCQGCTSLVSVEIGAKFSDGVLTHVAETDMSYAFDGCTSLATLDVSGMPTMRIASAEAMLRGCGKLATFYPNYMYVASGASLRDLFSGCGELKDVNLPKWTFKGNVADVSHMFDGCASFTTLDLSGLGTQDVTDMNSMFRGCSSLASLNISSFVTDNVTDMANMFRGCHALTSLDLSHFKTANVTSMNNMFSSCSTLETINLSSFVTDNVTDMGSMFQDCKALKNPDLHDFNTQNVTNMEAMFSGCASLTSPLDLHAFSTTKVRTMKNMFSRCTGLTSLDLSGFDTQNVTDMESMFDTCTKLANINLSGFDTRKVAYMRRMFGSCYALTSLDLTSFNTSNVAYISGMFSNDMRLSTIYVSDKFTTDKVDEVDATNDVFTRCLALNGAVAYDYKNVKNNMANYLTGYFKTYYKIGDTQHDLVSVESDGTHTLTATDRLDLATADFKACAPFAATEGATYSRTLPSATHWGTLCLPFAFNTAAVSGFTFYDLSGIDDNKSVLTVTALSGAVEAGRPVLFKADAAGATLALSAERGVQVVTAPTDGAVKDGLYFTGTFTEKPVADEGYVIGGDKFRHVADYNTDGKTVWTRGFYAYLLPTDDSAAQLCSSFSLVDGTVTGVEQVNGTATELLNAIDSGKATVYDISGHRLPSLRKGVNIVKSGTTVKKVVMR